MYVYTYGIYTYGTNLHPHTCACMQHAHEHADLPHTQAASQTTHAIHEVHVSPHAILKSISHVFKFNDIIM